MHVRTDGQTHTHPFNGPFSGTTQVSRYQKGKRDLDFTEARDTEWQWNQLDHMQVCTSLQADNHASTPPLCFLQAGCPSCHPTNSVKALKAIMNRRTYNKMPPGPSNTYSSFNYRHSSDVYWRFLQVTEVSLLTRYKQDLQLISIQLLNNQQLTKKMLAYQIATSKQFFM